jgi:hypothetical protein
MLFLALSCLQGGTQQAAYDELAVLEPDGIQLTPGNYPSLGFQERITIPFSFHHGFSWCERRPVYDAYNMPINIEHNRSIHPPKAVGSFADWIDRTPDHIYETMYPGYFLGNGAELEEAMNRQFRLALDLSHLHIMQQSGAVSKQTVDRLLSYDRVCEVHISHNDGKYDKHQVIRDDTPFLSEIRGRSVPVVYEAYLHRVSVDDRKRQIDLVRKAMVA